MKRGDRLSSHPGQNAGLSAKDAGRNDVSRDRCRGARLVVLTYDVRVNDTHPSADAVQRELLRRAGPAARAAIALRLSDGVVRRSRRALAQQMPGASDLEVKLRWVELWYGEELAARVRRCLRDRGVEA